LSLLIAFIVPPPGVRVLKGGDYIYIIDTGEGL
jgi:uncharacterized membrane protein YqaE (UPF0057 family)